LPHRRLTACGGCGGTGTQELNHRFALAQCGALHGETVQSTAQ
jgi:hypothetical protein